MKKENLKTWLGKLNRYKILEAVYAIESKHEEDSLIDAQAKCFGTYEKVIESLINFAPRKTFRDKHELRAYLSEDMLNPEDSYIHWSMYNKNYEEPAEGLKPWGGEHDDPNDAPEGYFNVNWENYCPHFSLSGVPWRIIANLDVTFDDTVKESMGETSMEEIFAALLYDLTFDGYTEYEAQFGFKMMMKGVINDKEEAIPYEEAMKIIKDYAEDRTEIEMPPENYNIKFTPKAIEDFKRMIDEEIADESR
jgi:hypothetical protein